MYIYIYIYTDHPIVKPQLCIMKPLLLMVKSPFYDNPNIMGISIPMNGRIITSPYPYANHGAGIFTVNNWVIFGAFFVAMGYQLPYPRPLDLFQALRRVSVTSADDEFDGCLIHRAHWDVPEGLQDLAGHEISILLFGNFTYPLVN